jgi:hypothetical protein
MALTAKDLENLAKNEDLMEVGRKAIEDELVDWRDRRLSTLLRNNGFTIKEKNGKPSDIIRFGPEVGVDIALRAIAKHLRKVQ